MARFKVIDHTADVGIIAYGKDLKEAFANAAYGMFSQIANLRGVKEEAEREVAIQSSDREALLVDWLNELLYLFDVDHIIFSRFDVTQLSQNSLKAKVYGERIDTSRHKLKTSIKAATYHMLRVGERKNGAEVQFILDI